MVHARGIRDGREAGRQAGTGRRRRRTLALRAAGNATGTRSGHTSVRRAPSREGCTKRGPGARCARRAHRPTRAARAPLQTRPGPGRVWDTTGAHLGKAWDAAQACAAAGARPQARRGMRSACAVAGALPARAVTGARRPRRGPRSARAAGGTRCARQVTRLAAQFQLRTKVDDVHIVVFSTCGAPGAGRGRRAYIHKYHARPQQHADARVCGRGALLRRECYVGR